MIMKRRLDSQAIRLAARRYVEGAALRDLARDLGVTYQALHRRICALHGGNLPVRRSLQPDASALEHAEMYLRALDVAVSLAVEGGSQSLSSAIDAVVAARKCHEGAGRE